MSVFSEDQVTPATQSEQVSAFEEPTSPSVLGDLVGDGRKFNDVEALAKGKLEADKFIEQMKQENASKIMTKDENFKILTSSIFFPIQTSIKLLNRVAEA